MALPGPGRAACAIPRGRETSSPGRVGAGTQGPTACATRGDPLMRSSCRCAGYMQCTAVISAEERPVSAGTASFSKSSFSHPKQRRRAGNDPRGGNLLLPGSPPLVNWWIRQWRVNGAPHGGSPQTPREGSVFPFVWFVRKSGGRVRRGYVGTLAPIVWRWLLGPRTVF